MGYVESKKLVIALIVFAILPAFIAAQGEPAISDVKCEKGGSWENCETLVFGDTLTGVHAKCDDPDGVDSVSFLLINVPDSEGYAAGSALPDGGYYALGLNSQIEDSGEFLLTVSCDDSTGTSSTKMINWTVPWGTLQAGHIAPEDGTTIQNGGAFAYSAKLSCSGGECGMVSAALDPAFGNENMSCIIGGICNSYPKLQDGNKIATKYRMGPVEGKLKSISAYLFVIAGASYGAAIYMNDNGQPGKKLNDSLTIYSTPFTIGSTLVTFDFSNEKLEPDAYYWLALGASGSSTDVYHDAGRVQQTASSPGLPQDSADFGPGIIFSDLAKNIFATYETRNGEEEGIFPSATPVISPTPSFGQEPAPTASASTLPPVTGPKKSILAVGSGSPFYTTDRNPANCNEMKDGDTCETSWNVLANGSAGIYEFFVIYNSSSPGVAAAESPHVPIILGVGAVPEASPSPTEQPAEGNPSTSIIPADVIENTPSAQASPDFHASPSPTITVASEAERMRQLLLGAGPKISEKDRTDIAKLILDAEAADTKGDTAQAFILLSTASERINAAMKTPEDVKIDFVWYAAAGAAALLFGFAIYYYRRTHRKSRLFRDPKDIDAEEFMKKIQKNEEQPKPEVKAMKKEEPHDPEKMELIRI
ncbi:MAG: hypothetical protein ABIG96_06630 [Candidatus Micrarchaeota archaeon]